MSASKRATLALRIDPCLKDALKTAASQEHRSITNMVEVMILTYCHQAGITVPAASEQEKAKLGPRLPKEPE